MAARKRNGTSHVEKKLAALQSDLVRLQNDLRGLASAGGEVATDRMADAVDQVEDAADRAADQLEAWANENIGSLRDTVRAQPLSAVLVTMGAGALVGALFLRR